MHTIPSASRTPEPVFGIITSVLAFRQFLLLGFVALVASEIV